MGSVYMLVLIQCTCFEGFSSFSSLPTPFLLTNVSKFQFDVEYEGHMLPLQKNVFSHSIFLVNSCQYILLFCVAEGYVLLNF